MRTRFAAGSLAMLLSSRRDTPGFREVAGLDFDVAALPVAAEPATLLHSDAFCISRGRRPVDAAADFVAFATGTQGQTLAALSGRSVPALKSVADSPAFLSPGRPPASSQVFLDAIPTIRAFPSWPTWTEVEDLAEVSLQQVIWQGAPAAATLAELDAASRPVLARWRRMTALPSRPPDGSSPAGAAARRWWPLRTCRSRSRRRSILVVLGPSGSGKSTLLRAVAGLERLDAGRITLRGRDVTDDPPGRRDVGMVFQDQALLPHLSVLENIAFGEVARGTPRPDARARAGEAAETVGVSGLLARWPGQLSGGEAQRVALARALVRRPAAFLLDEPLSALDPVLRVRLREELRDLQRATGTAVLHVTHDQQEALSLADRIAVLREGRVVQVGTPEELHRAPADVFVAEFVAALPFNLLAGAAVGAAAPTVGIRPERCRLTEAWIRAHGRPGHRRRLVG